MKNLMKKIRKANKGFTLVELIIVIAIIAVLAAVAAPQYIKYVERSRNSTLEAAASSAIDIVKAEAALGNITLATDKTSATITFTDGTIDVSADVVYKDGVYAAASADAAAEEAGFVAFLGDPVNNGATATYVVQITGESGSTITNAVKGSTWG